MPMYSKANNHVSYVAIKIKRLQTHFGSLLLLYSLKNIEKVEEVEGSFEVFEPRKHKALLRKFLPLDD